MFQNYIMPPVNKTISSIRHTNTRATKHWKDVIFFDPIAVPVHGQLHQKTKQKTEMNKTSSPECPYQSKQWKYQDNIFNLRMIEVFDNNRSVRIKICTSWLVRMGTVTPSPATIATLIRLFHISWQYSRITKGCHR